MAAAIQELTVSPSHISDSARETERDSPETMTVASQGSKRVDEVTAAIRKIAATVTDASTRKQRSKRHGRSAP